MRERERERERERDLPPSPIYGCAFCDLNYLVNSGLKTQMENSRNKQFVDSKLGTVVNSMANLMSTYSILLKIWTVAFNSTSTICKLPPHIYSNQCLCSVMAPKCKNSNIGNEGLPKRSGEVLPVSEKWNYKKALREHIRNFYYRI
jgi:hypothetical protein